MENPLDLRTRTILTPLFIFHLCANGAHLYYDVVIIIHLHTNNYNTFRMSLPYGKGIFILERITLLLLTERMIFIPKNVGKIFEQNFKASVPDDVMVYRPPDAAQSFDMSSKLRFSQHSPCDFMIFSGKRHTFWTLELKTFEGSCSFERSKEEKGIIHYYQVESLKKFSTYENICSGFILDFRKSGNTYFLMIDEWDDLVNSISKKSFNEDDLLKYCNPILINKKKLKVNYRYDIEDFLNNTRLN